MAHKTDAPMASDRAVNRGLKTAREALLDNFHVERARVIGMKVAVSAVVVDSDLKARYAAINYGVAQRLKPFAIGLAVAREAGYSPPLPMIDELWFDSYDEAQKAADRLNSEVLGLDKKQAFMIVGSTMFPYGNFGPEVDRIPAPKVA